MELKNINLPKVNVDTQKMMGAMDGLVDKIPPQVQDLLKKIALSLLVFFLVVAIYLGWTKGWESATPQGLQLAQDTRSLFLMEVERDYNRKRKDVVLSDPEELRYESNRRMQFDFQSEREGSGYTHDAIPEEKEFLGKEYDFRNRKSLDTNTPPVILPSGEGLMPSPIDFNPPSAETRALDSSEEDIRMKRMLDRVGDLEKKLKEKQEKSLKAPSLREGSGESTPFVPKTLERRSKASTE